MNIIELSVCKKQLEIDISSAVSMLVEKFKKDTGVSPNSISTDMLFIDSMGFTLEYVVGETSISIDI